MTCIIRNNLLLLLLFYSLRYKIKSNANKHLIVSQIISIIWVLKNMLNLFEMNQANIFVLRAENNIFTPFIATKKKIFFKLSVKW